MKHSTDTTLGLQQEGATDLARGGPAGKCAVGVAVLSAAGLVACLPHHLQRSTPEWQGDNGSCLVINHVFK